MCGRWRMRVQRLKTAPQRRREWQPGCGSRGRTRMRSRGRGWMSWRRWRPGVQRLSSSLLTAMGSWSLFGRGCGKWSGRRERRRGRRSGSRRSCV